MKHFTRERLIVYANNLLKDLPRSCHLSVERPSSSREQTEAPMISMKCGRCGLTAQAPDSLLHLTVKCFRCGGVSVAAATALALPEFAPRRAGNADRLVGIAVAALLGAILFPALSVWGGRWGMAIASGAAGAFLAGILGLVYGLHEMVSGGEFGKPDPGEFSSLELWTLVGLLGGFALGATGHYTELYGCGVMLTWSSMGGLFVGGLLGERFSRC